MFAVMMTCLRPDGADYRIETTVSLRNSGVQNYGFINDGPARFGSGVRLGIVPTFRKAVFAGLEQLEDSRIAVFQDDIEAPQNLAHIIEHELPSERGVFSLYLTEGREAPLGWSTIDKSDTYPLNVGACGIVMDAETARLFVESPPFPRVDRLGSQLVTWCWQEGIPFWQHSPSLLIHRGVVSCRS